MSGTGRSLIPAFSGFKKNIIYKIMYCPQLYYYLANQTVLFWEAVPLQRLIYEAVSVSALIQCANTTTCKVLTF